MRHHGFWMIAAVVAMGVVGCDGESVAPRQTGSGPNVDGAADADSVDGGRDGGGVETVDVGRQDGAADAQADGSDAAPVDAAVAPQPRCPPDPASAWTSDGVLQPGPHRVGERSVALVDHSRATAAHGLFPESPQRVLATMVWYPAQAGPLGDLTPPINAPLASGNLFYDGSSDNPIPTI